MRRQTPGRFDEVYLSTLAYYTEQILRHGATPRGVSWLNTREQQLRFAQLSKICDLSTGFALNDLGCGYGALYRYFVKHHRGVKIDYLGIDLSSTMIREARRFCGKSPGADFVVGNLAPREADYSVASGIFNIMLDVPVRLWEQFVVDTLANLRATSRKGFAVNFVAAASGRKAHAGLYATTPQKWVRHCRSKLGCAVELLQGYGLDEFTLLVRPGKLS